MCQDGYLQIKRIDLYRVLCCVETAAGAEFRHHIARRIQDRASMLKRLDPDSGDRPHAHSTALCNWRMQGWVEGHGSKHHEVYEEAEKGIRVSGRQDEKWSRHARPEEIARTSAAHACSVTI
jgi:hypothetical protein